MFVGGFGDCFHLLAIMSNTGMNMGIQVSLQDPGFDSLGYIQVKLLDQLFHLTLESQGPNQY